MVTLGEDEGGDGCCGGLRGDVSNDLEPTSLVGPRQFCLYLCISMVIVFGLIHCGGL